VENPPNKLLLQCNDRLKLGQVGVSVIQRGDRLSLRATLPPKTGDGKPRQQIVSLGIYANPAGYQRAEIEAKRLGGDLALGRFDWADWIQSSEQNSFERTVAEIVDQIEQEYFSRRQRTSKTLTTWETEYQAMFLKLPANKAVSAEVLKKFIESIQPDTRTRKRACLAANLIAKTAGIDFDATPYAGSYSPRRVSPRDLPVDKDISIEYYKIKDLGWQYVYGLMACYGLRNHEVFLLDLASLKERPGVVQILDGKTGPRKVWPCYPEWWDEFELSRTDRLPVITGRTNRDKGSRVSHAFKRLGVPFSPYNLRHCWAIRTIGFGWDLSLAAAQMGHSVQVHTSTYHHWISDRHHQRAFDALLSRPGRPLPP
jgi:integrase